jgi:APA family basic amino acid/polyamine antiporter
MTSSVTSSMLRPAIGVVRATAMVVGIIIGASIFVQPSQITGEVGTIGGVLLVWTIAGALTLIGSLIAAELSSAFPRTGGVYVFLAEAYGPAVGFLWGWAMFWTMHTGIIAAIAVVFARYVGFFAPLDDTGLRVVAIAAILIITAINYLGVRQGSAVQTGFTLVKVGAILLIIVAGFVLAPRAASAPAAAVDAVTTGISLRAVGTALVAALFAFGGWHMVTYASGETVAPRRTIPLALLIGTLVVSVCYIALNAAYLHVLPLETVAASTRVAADFADAVMGSGAAIMSVLVIISTVGALAGVILAGPRVYLAMAGDGLLFRWLGAVHPVHRTPHRALVIQAVWASVLVATGTYRALFTRVIYTEWIFFGLMAAGLLILRRRSGYAPEYRMWCAPLLAVLFIAVTAAIVANQIASEPASSAVGLLLVLAGLPVYHLWIRRRPSAEIAHESR